MLSETYSPGTTIDRYAVEKVLGQGGMAVVYRVRHTQLGTLHALKVLTMPVQSIQRRLLQEGRVQARLRHPNIVSVTDVVEVRGVPGLVMEYIDGPTLAALLEAGRVTLDQADVLAEGVISGVAFAHDHGLIHRDLKPGNILLAVDDKGITPKVADFGLVKVLAGEEGEASTETRSGAAMGTPAYMAPEQIRSTKDVDERADVFSLGVILYEVVSGRRPFDGSDNYEVFQAIMAGNYVHPRDLVPDLPERMQGAIIGALDVDRNRRIHNCHRLLEVWQGRATHSETPAPVGVLRLGPWDAAALEHAISLGSRGEAPLLEPSSHVAPDSTWAGTPVPALHAEDAASIGPVAGAARGQWRRRAVAGAVVAVGVGVVALVLVRMATEQVSEPVIEAQPMIEKAIPVAEKPVSVEVEEIPSAPAKTDVATVAVIRPKVVDEKPKAEASPQPPRQEPVPATPVGHAVTHREFARWLEGQTDWQREPAMAANKADSAYLLGWEGTIPPPGAAGAAVVNVSWSAAAAYCAKRGGLADLDVAPLEWAESPLQPAIEYRQQNGRAAWRGMGMGSTSVQSLSDTNGQTGFRCAR